VENAVRHGIAQRTGPGMIEIRAFTADGRLFLEVRDSGPGFSAEHTGGEGTGVGLANTRARLEQLYGGEHRLETVNAPGGGAIVRVVIPFRPFEGDRVTDAAPFETEARTA
jgi:sensor histidine kinase YesM